MTDGPTMRASLVKSNVESLGDFGIGVEERVRASVPATVKEAENALRTAWLPLALDIALTEAVEEHTSRDRMRQWSADSIARSADGPLLRPIRDALLGMGLSGHHGVKRVEFIWGLIYRDCGTITHQRISEREALLVHRDAPHEMLASAAYLHGITGTLEGGLLLLGEHEPDVTFEADPDARRVEYRCTWPARHG